MRSPKAPRRRAVICASNEPNEYACIFTRRKPQQPTECRLPQSWSAPNQTGDATPSPLRFGRCRANVHRTFCTPALAAASYPFVDLLIPKAAGNNSVNRVSIQERIAIFLSGYLLVIYFSYPLLSDVYKRQVLGGTIQSKRYKGLVFNV